MIAFFNQDMFDKTTRVIYVCGKHSTPVSFARVYLDVKSRHTDKVLRFEPCKSSPFNDNRIYYYNAEVNTYATL